MLTEPSTLPALLRHQRHRGAHPLLVCDDQRISYADADRRSARLAKGLLALGVGKGTHVGVLQPNGTEFVEAMLAAARIGAVVVPFSTFLTAGELHQQLAGSDVVLMLAARSFRSHDYVRRFTEALGIDDSAFAEPLFTTEAPSLRHVVFDTGRLCAHGETVDEALLTAVEDDVHGADTLAIIYTSGSTGIPKGAVHTHAAMIGHQGNLNTIRGLTADDRLFSNSPFFWVGGFAFGLLATLAAGATLICSNATDAGDTLDLIEMEKPTVTNGFAAPITHLTRHPSFAERDLSALRRGNLYPIMAPAARPADPGLRHNMLGMTEAGSVVLISGDDSDQPESRRGSYGRPAPGFETKILDTGELCIRGPFVMQGYYGRSRAECFDPDGWFHTGDLVRTDSDGFFYFHGRAGSMIKTAGANVTPTEVESALSKVLANSVTGEPGVHVLGLPDAERGQIVAAVIALDDITDFDITDFDEAAVRRRLRSEISAYKVPQRFAVCRRADIPLLSSGKVDIAGLTKFFDV
ncbi:MAG: class I adenylate-forming enzyme family protein [Mycobacterium sp.]